MLRRLFSKKSSDHRVLVVEDDAMLSKVLTDSLKAEQMEVVAVFDGTKVMDEALRFSPNIILLDLILPGIDGFAVLKQLREDSRTKNIPVVVLSNLSQASDVKAVRTLGAEQYFVKANTKLDIIIDYVKNKLNM